MGAAGTGAAGMGADGGAGAMDGAPERLPTTTIDPGWVGMRLLTDAEYDNTMRDLLGVTTTAYRALADRGPEGEDDVFDNLAERQPISLQRYQWYFAAAVGAAEAAFANPDLRGKVVACVPSSGADEVCAQNSLRTFGERAWRRPLDGNEVEGLLRVVRDAWKSGADFHGGVRQAVVAMLVSDAFLFRIELDPTPNSAAVHALTPFDVATRLSYLLWGSTPDITLLALATQGRLYDTEALRAQVNRMLADARADGFVRNFAGQWLDFRRLDGPAFVKWPAGLQAAALEEARRFVELIVVEDRPLTDLFTMDVNFVDETLAAHYGFPAPATGVARVSVTTDARKGYLGLVAPLALTSGELESSPTLRGKFVLERLLCSQIPADPSALLPPPAGNTPRERAASIAAMGPQCTPCHTKMDPIGLGLEAFGPLGHSRITYDNGTLVDSTGALDGTQFSGVSGLADVLAADPRLPRCAARKAISYALGRRLETADDATVERVARAFEGQGLTIRGLLSAIVTDDVFRFRRGEGKP
jgi:hypothetical protein